MNTDHTLEEVGKQFDVTRERIVNQALRKLRHPTRPITCAVFSTNKVLNIAQLAEQSTP